MADAPRGRGSGRARGRGGRGGNTNSRGGGNQPPLAAQLRQLDRLQEPDEMAVLRRYSDLDAIQVRSTYGRTGLLDRQVLIPGSVLALANPNADPETEAWVNLLQADAVLAAQRRVAERDRALSRREARLPQARWRATWDQLTPEERRILLLSQKEFNSFRARTGSAGTTSQRATSGPAQAGPSNQGGSGSTTAINVPGENGGDDASDEEDGGNEPPPPKETKGSPKGKGKK